MKLEKIESLRPHQYGRCYTCFLYVANGHRAGDSVYVGSECGRVSVYNLLGNSQHISSIKEEDLDKENASNSHHTAYITCLMHSNHRLLTSQSAEGFGLLFSGSRDGNVKCWNSDGQVIQTLPHSSSISVLTDGADGTMLSVCVDGYLRMWSPQPGRQMMLNPFFECTCSVSVLNPQDGWISAIAVNPQSRWTVFLGEFDGSISVYRKPAKDLNMSDEQKALTQNTVKRHARWDEVHRLSITQLYLMQHNGYLISLSSDCTCKVSDQVLGHPIYSMENKSKCLFTGLSFMQDTRYFLLPDELGNVHKFDFSKEKIIDMTTLSKPSRVRKDKILSVHQDPVLGTLEMFRNTDQFLVFLKPPPKRGLSSGGGGEPTSVLHKHDIYTEGGEIALWKCVDQDSSGIIEFIGHDGPVVMLGVFDALAQANNIVSSTTKTTKSRKGEVNNVVFQVSTEEMALFSVASDRTIRCWDEFDTKENFQFKTKSRVDMISACMLWSMNSLATGHENGQVTLWNSDAGTNLSSNALSSPLTCLVEANNNKAHILMGSDFSGMIAIWNLTLFKLNPKELPLESLIKGHHDSEDASILSLAFHKTTNTFFSGGTDTNICCWRLDSVNFTTLTNHTAGVVSLQCTENYLLSGDEAGEVILWLINATVDPLANTESSITGTSNHLPKLTKLIRWYGLQSGDTLARSIISLKEIDPLRLFLIQSNDGYAKQSVVWKVHATTHVYEEIKDAEPTEVDGVVGGEGEKKVVSVTSTMKKVDLAASIGTGAATSPAKNETANAKDAKAASATKAKAPAPAAAAPQDAKKGASTKTGSATRPDKSMLSLDVNSQEPENPKQDDEQFRIFQPYLADSSSLTTHLLTEQCLHVQLVQTLVHEHDISCAEILLSETGNSIKGLYFGTQAGPIYKHSMNIDCKYGEIS